MDSNRSLKQRLLRHLQAHLPLQHRDFLRRILIVHQYFPFLKPQKCHLLRLRLLSQLQLVLGHPLARSHQWNLRNPLSLGLLAAFSLLRPLPQNRKQLRHQKAQKCAKTVNAQRATGATHLAMMDRDIKPGAKQPSLFPPQHQLFRLRVQRFLYPQNLKHPPVQKSCAKIANPLETIWITPRATTTLVSSQRFPAQYRLLKRLPLEKRPLSETLLLGLTTHFCLVVGAPILHRLNRH